MVIYGSNLKDKEVADQISTLKNKIKELSGNVSKEDFWGLKKFSYEINKMTEGYYIVLNLELDQSKVNDVKNWLKMQEKFVVRSLLCKSQV